MHNKIKKNVLNNRETINTLKKKKKKNTLSRKIQYFTETDISNNVFKKEIYKFGGKPFTDTYLFIFIYSNYF